MHGEAAVQESIDNRPVRHLNRHRDPAWVARGRHQPIAQGCQAGSAVREVPLAHDLAGSIEKADLVLLRAPIDASKPAYSAITHDPYPPGRHEPPQRWPIPVRALQGATSYWACIVANPLGHMSHDGARGTGGRLVAPNELTRLVTLQLLATRQLRRVQGGRPRRPWCARVEVLNTTRGRRPWVRLAPSVWIWRRASSRSTEPMSQELLCSARGCGGARFVRSLRPSPPARSLWRPAAAPIIGRARLACSGMLSG